MNSVTFECLHGWETLLLPDYKEVRVLTGLSRSCTSYLRTFSSAFSNKSPRSEKLIVCLLLFMFFFVMFSLKDGLDVYDKYTP